MKYFSLETVARAYYSLSGCTKNQFWGVLGILQTLDSEVIPGRTYPVNTALLSSFLEELFCLEKNKKEYNSTDYWNVKFSKEWISKMSEQMLPNKPDVYDLIVWVFRKRALDNMEDPDSLLKVFSEKFHLSLEEMKRLFHFEGHDYYKYSDSLYDDTDLYQDLVIHINNPFGYKNVTAENTLVAIHPGELLHTPFIQTLYADRNTLKCLILVPFNIDDYYPNAVPMKKAGQLGDYRSYVTAIKSKPFILLAGISGTGKSRIVRELARACYDKDSEEYKAHKPVNFEMIQVCPNWHDSTELLGYVSRIDGEKFIAGDFLRFIVKAWIDEKMPYFLCLDEMNLAPVEQYFAEYLSVIESREVKEGRIVTDPLLRPSHEAWYEKMVVNLLEEAGCPDHEIFAWKVRFIEEGISIPQNLIVMGTVNMDETTFSFSRKVLDRAMSIEINEVNMYSGLEQFGGTIARLNADALIGSAVRGEDVYPVYKDVCREVLTYLETLNEELDGTPFKVAYRTRNEFLLYVVNNMDYVEEGELPGEMIATALDEITSMKILSRIEGDESRIAKDFLPRLKSIIREKLNELSGKEYVENKVSGDMDKVLSVSLKKLAEMDRKLRNTGYTSYWC